MSIAGWVIIGLVLWCLVSITIGPFIGRAMARRKPPAGGGAGSPRPDAETVTPQAAVPPVGPHPAHPHDLPPDAGAPVTILAAAGTRRVREIWYIADCGCAWGVDIRAKTTEQDPCKRHAFDVDAWNTRLAQS